MIRVITEICSFMFTKQVLPIVQFHPVNLRSISLYAERLRGHVHKADLLQTPVCVTVKLISFVNHVFPPSSMFGLFVCLGNYCCFRCCYQRRVERKTSGFTDNLLHWKFWAGWYFAYNLKRQNKYTARSTLSEVFKICVSGHTYCFSWRSELKLMLSK